MFWHVKVGGHRYYEVGAHRYILLGWRPSLLGWRLTVLPAENGSRQTR